MTVGDLTVLVERKDFVQYCLIIEEKDSENLFCFRTSGPTSRPSEKIRNFFYELNQFLVQLDQQIFHIMRSIDQNIFVYESASHIRRVPQFVSLDALQMFIESAANCNLDFLEDHNFVPAQFKRTNGTFSIKTPSNFKTNNRFHRIAKILKINSK